MEYKTNLFDYLKWRGDLSFEASPFNHIDGMILSRFSYAPFGLVLPEKGDFFYSVREVAENLIKNPKTPENVLIEDDVELIRQLGEHPRFADLMIGRYVDLYDQKDEVQFSAIALRFSEGEYGIVFRGTDNTLIGWKEDLNMGFEFPIASQRYAREYLEVFAEKYPGTYLLMGHSKGGNLASYAAAFCSPTVQEQIRGVYNYDGPGFDESVLKEEGFKRICKRLYTYVPQGSVVGMLLGHLEEHQVVHSMEFRGPFQHNVYSWEVQGKDFIYEEGITKTSKNLDLTMKTWMANMDKEKRELFVEALFSLVAGTNAKTFKDMKNDWMQNSQIIFKSMKQMDEETRAYIKEGIGLFMKCAWSNVHSDNDRANRTG
jgi:hypothetical protein